MTSTNIEKSNTIFRAVVARYYTDKRINKNAGKRSFFMAVCRKVGRS